MVTLLVVSLLVVAAGIDRFLLLRQIGALREERSSLLGRLTRCGAAYQDLVSTQRGGPRVSLHA